MSGELGGEMSNSQENLTELSSGHWQMLNDESVIKPELIQERGYRTIKAAKELSSLGFAPRQQRVPGLLIPIFAPDGSPALFQ